MAKAKRRRERRYVVEIRTRSEDPNEVPLTARRAGEVAAFDERGRRHLAMSYPRDREPDA